jgi:two-component system response regulator BaeR
MSQKILIIEDELKIANLLRDYLQQAGFTPFIINKGSEAVPWVKAFRTDLILLDLMLPGQDGLAICKEIRTFSKVPIIMITARIREEERVRGLEAGADDYICKPFYPHEVVARVKAVLRRTSSTSSSRAEGLVLDEKGYTAALHGENLNLTAVEFNLLRVLMAHPGHILSRDQLMEKIYSDQRIVNDRTIDAHIKKLRKKLNAVSPGEELILSVYGVGYKFNPPAEPPPPVPLT